MGGKFQLSDFTNSIVLYTLERLILMRKYIKIKYILFTIAITTALNFGSFSVTTWAWGDNGDGRPSYTIEEINNGAIGATKRSDGENYKESENYPGTIVFNSISNSVIGDEKNFVGARECIVQADGRCNAANSETIWNANEIDVKDDQTYVIRAYVHNNNPNGTDAVAENTRVEFVIPENSGKEIEVNGIINSSNATPSRYWDHVTFKSDNIFHLEYISGSALFENNAIGLGGITLSDDVVNGGTLIGYDKLDGRIPGCYEYDGFVGIQVKVVYDDFTINTQVRLAGEKEWQDTIEAEVGDMVEFQIEYKNTSDERQTNVVLRDLLPPNLRYVPSSTKLKNSNYPNGTTVNEDILIDDNGFNVGNYAAGANVFVMFTTEVIDDSLALGKNNLINKGQAYVNSRLLEDRAVVVTNKDAEPVLMSAQSVLIPAIVIAILGFLVIIVRLIYKIIKLNRRK